jgi:hypothetical protein
MQKMKAESVADLVKTAVSLAPAKKSMAPAADRVNHGFQHSLWQPESLERQLLSPNTNRSYQAILTPNALRAYVSGPHHAQSFAVVPQLALTPQPWLG